MNSSINQSIEFTKKKSGVFNNRKIKYMINNYQLYIFLLPTIIYFIIFKYVPMYGLQIAFKKYSPVKGFTGSPWIGFEHFQRYLNSADFWLLMKNTLGISLYALVVGFPLPIILALLLNQMGGTRYKRVIQTVVYAPHFISTVVVVGMIMVFLSPSTGVVNVIIKQMGFEPIFFMGEPQYFKTIYVLSGIWQSTGWNSVIYLASLAGINPELYESAVVDGASKFRRILHIDIPGIMPTAITLLILNSGQLLSVGFEKAYLMQNSLNRITGEIIQTYVYKQGLIQGNFSYAAAIGLFDAVINLSILLLVNYLSKKYSETSLL